MDAKVVVAVLLAGAVFALPLIGMAHSFSAVPEKASDAGMMSGFQGMMSSMMGFDMAEHHEEMETLMEQYQSGEITPEEFSSAMVREMQEMPCHGSGQ